MKKMAVSITLAMILISGTVYAQPTTWRNHQEPPRQMNSHPAFVHPEEREAPVRYNRSEERRRGHEPAFQHHPSKHDGPMGTENNNRSAPDWRTTDRKPMLVPFGANAPKPVTPVPTVWGSPGIIAAWEGSAESDQVVGTIANVLTRFLNISSQVQ